MQPGRRRGSLQHLVKKHSFSVRVLRSSLAMGTGEEQKAEEKRPRKKLSEAWKEGCRLMRVFLFGSVGNEGVQDEQEKDAVYYDPLGSKSMVADLYAVWSDLDSDQSGRVDISEFRCFAEHRERSKVSSIRPTNLRSTTVAALNVGTDPAKFIQKLCEKLEKLLLAKKSSFTIEDMMRICWPTATPADVKTMWQWCTEQQTLRERSRIKPPPVMPKAEFEGLTSVFHLYDEDGGGTLEIEELFKHELIRNEEEKQEMLKNGKKELNALEFCEMLCPAGFRATAQSESGTLNDGRRVVLDARLGCWRLADSSNDGEEADLV